MDPSRPTGPRLGAGLRTDAAEAVRSEDRTWSWAELDERVARAAAALRAAGVGPDARVAVLDRNSPAVLEVALGGSRVGAVTTVVNWRLAPEELHFALEDSTAEVLVVGHELAPVVEPLRERLPRLRTVVVLGGPDDGYEPWLTAHEPDPTWAERSPDDAVLQLYTSGTTGFPKGVMLTSRSVAAHDAAAARVVPPTPDAVALVPMPLYHVGGLAYALSKLAAGVRVVVTRDPVPSLLLEVVERERVTETFVVPALVAALLQEPSLPERDLSSLRHLLYGASPMPAPLMRAALARFPGVLGQVYGMTELSGAVTWLSPEDHADLEHPERLQSAGRPYPGVEVRVVDDTGTDVPAGQLGELWVRSEQAMAGYWQRPEATAETLVDGGWVRTGDVARLDEGGFVYLEDRLKDMIISGGENVYPAEVERVLLLDPSVGEVAVIGVPDDRWGETVKACVVAAPGASVDPAQLDALCRSHLAGYKRPTSYDVLPELPRNATGKVLRRELRAPFWSGSSRAV